MALTALGGMNYAVIGGLSWQGALQRPVGVTNITQDAANEATHMIGQMWWEDGGSHTVDTTLASRLEFRTGATTFANGSTTFVVGLAAVDLATGPPGRAANASDVITLDVAWSGVGSGSPGITANAWQSKTPTTGTKTIAHGDFIAFCTQMTARAGADSIITVAGATNSGQRPFVTTFTGGAYAVAASTPVCVVIASDGTRGYLFGGSPFSVALSTTFNSGSSPNERGNLITLPGPARIIGAVANVTPSANFDLVVYSDATGTPVARGTASFDANAVNANAANLPMIGYFAPYTAAAGSYAVVCKPGVSNVTISGVTLNDANYQNAYPLGVGGNAINRASGAFGQQNSGLDRYGIGILIDSIDNAVSAGAGMLVHPGMQGGIRA